MASRRARLRTARRTVLMALVAELERDLSMSCGDEIIVIEALIAEFRRRGRLTPVASPPGHAHLPGMETANG
jgi:hypothetical protein